MRGLKKEKCCKIISFHFICSHTSQVCLFDADSCSSEFEISKFLASLFLWPFVVRAWRATTHKTFNMINFLKVNNKIWIKMLRKKNFIWKWYLLRNLPHIFLETWVLCKCLYGVCHVINILSTLNCAIWWHKVERIVKS